MDETLYVGFNQLMLLKVTYIYVLGALLSKFRLDRSFCTCSHCLMLYESLRCFLLIHMLLLSHSSFVACHCRDFTASGWIPFPFFLPTVIPWFITSLKWSLFPLWLSCPILLLNVLINMISHGSFILALYSVF